MVKPSSSGWHLSYLVGFQLHLTNHFDVWPGISYYDDGGEPNALAIPIALLPDGPFGGPDGTVLLGINLFDKEFGRANLAASSSPTASPFFLTPLAIIAHEFGHIMQFKNGMNPEGPWQMEPHADFMSGWLLSYVQSSAHNPGIKSEEMVEGAVKAFFEIGDYAFNDRSHHGEPEFRAAMVRAGYESGNLDRKQAFEKGKRFAGLK